MMVLVSYDVAEDDNGKKRLRKVAKICQNFGQRVQYSVFECLVEPAQWSALKNQLLSAIKEEYDSLRFYFLGANWKRHVEHVGSKPAYDPEGTIIA